MAKAAGGAMVLLVILVVGALIGSVIGEVVVALMPGGYVAAIFTQGINPGLTPPAVLDLKVLTITLGATMRINLASVLGITLALLIYKRL